jgi:hypothetical protein
MEIPWLDRTAYPFSHHTLEVDGGRVHYVDGSKLVSRHSRASGGKRAIQALALRRTG